MGGWPNKKGVIPPKLQIFDYPEGEWSGRTAQLANQDKTSKNQVVATFVPPARYQLGEEVETPTGRGNAQFWLNDKENGILLVVSQNRKQTELPPGSLWVLRYLKPNKVKKN